MEVLLRYTLMSFIIKILLLELVIILVCCLGIVIFKTMAKNRISKEKKYKEDLSRLVGDVLTSKTSVQDFAIPFQLRQFKEIIEILEEFDLRITDPVFTELKEKIVNQYLLPNMQSYIENKSWIKRQLAARCLLLNPKNADEKTLELLLNDPKFLVRIVSAVCITKTSYKNLFEQVIIKMSEETALSRFSYRDALMQVSSEKFDWIEEILKKNINPTISAICLDLLSTRTTHNLVSLVLPFIYGQNAECKLLGVKLLKNSPSIEAFEVLMHSLTDADSAVRAESIKSLSSAYPASAVSKIQGLLHDPVWFVRLQAALFLKKCGNEGVRILSNQNPLKEPKAYEIAQYVLALP